MTHFEESPDEQICFEDQRLNDLFDSLLIAQSHLETYGDRDKTLDYFQEEISELTQILDGRTITVTGSDICMSELSDTGATGVNVLAEGSIKAKFDKIDIFDDEKHEGETITQSVALRLYLSGSITEGKTLERVDKNYAVANIKSCSFSVEQIIDIDPDIDDELSKAINEAFLAVPVDLEKLVKVFQETIEGSVDDDNDAAPSLQHIFYLQYLNRIAEDSIDEVSAITSFGVEVTGTNYVLHQGDDKNYKLDGSFAAFELQPFADETTGEYHLKLMLYISTENDTSLGTPVEDISAIELI